MPARPRLVALDVARALALVGMVLVNVGPLTDDGPAAWPIRAAHGRASLLFVLLAGVGVGLLLGSRSRRPVGALLARAAVLLVGGLALQLLGHEVHVILPSYAALFVIALAVPLLPDRALLTASLLAVVVGPLVWMLAQRGGEFAMVGPTLADAPGDVLAGVLLTGPYPVVTWLAPFLLGAWLARQDLADRRLQRRLLAIGAVATVLPLVVSAALGAAGVEEAARTDVARLASAVAHSQTPLWLVTGTGSALVVLALVLRLTPQLGRLAVPLAALGRLSLTAYVAHLLLLAALVRPGPTTAAGGLALSVGFAVVALVAAHLWERRVATPGPVETVLRAPERLLERARRRRAAPTTVLPNGSR